VIFGPLEKPALAALKDLDFREVIALAPLVVLTIVFGVFPNLVLNVSATSVASLVENYSHALGAMKAAALP
jgi:NADH-quinone oxidoreductase subunit M